MLASMTRATKSRLKREFMFLRIIIEIMKKLTFATV